MSKYGYRLPIFKRIMTGNAAYKAGKDVTPKRVLTHSTDCAYVAAKDWYQRWNTGERQAGVSFFVDDKEAWNYLPVALHKIRRNWGCGKGRRGSYNNDAVQYEICQDGHNYNREYFEKCYKNAVELTCFCLLEIVGTTTVNKNTVTSHVEAYEQGYGSGHGDPVEWWKHFDTDMNDFRGDVRERLEEIVNGGSTTQTKEVVTKWKKFVKGLQKSLNKDYHADLEITMELDKATLKALKKHNIQEGAAYYCAKHLQYWLNDRGFTDANGNKLEVDGDFGHKTKEALMKAQNKIGERADGIFGTGTCKDFVKLF